MATSRKFGLARLQAIFVETFGLGRGVAFGATLLTCVAMLLAVFWFFYSAPPNTIVVSAGPKGSIFEKYAENYEKILARNHVKLKILPSRGALENLTRLNDPSVPVDVGFVQGGVAGGLNIDKLVSLGSISYEPLLVFYRGAKPVTFLSQLEGMRLAIGQTGSGTHTLALTLLAANGIAPGGPTTLVDLDAEDAAKALTDGKVDAVFLMGDFASPEIMRSLLKAPGIHLLDFTQADAYSRRFTYLNKLDLPMGSLDFGKNLPEQDHYLIGPTVELIARPNLHPALSDLLLEAAVEVHGSAGLLKRRGEFPAPLEHEFRISDDARRFYKSGKSFLYRSLPFWVATLVDRFVVVFVPLVVILVPVLRMVPSVYRWRIRMRILRWYRVLLALERDMLATPPLHSREDLLAQLDRISDEVNKMKMPASYADQFYVLREHIGFVRERLMEGTKS